MKGVAIGAGVVVGGGAVGTECALFLAEEGTPSAEAVRSFLIFGMDEPENIAKLLNKGAKKVSISGRKIGKGIGPGTKFSMMARLGQLNVNMYKGTHVVEIKKDGVVLEDEEGRRSFEKADTVVIATGAIANGSLYEEIKASSCGAKINIIGDADKGGHISDAMEAAYDLAVTI